MDKSELWIQCWNIYGVFKNINGFTYNKLDDPDFKRQTQNSKIFGLVETQHVADDIDQLQINDHKCFQVCRKKKKYGRKHGGIAVFVHNSILNGVSKIPTQGSECVILKLSKDFFKINKDTYLLFVYCSPANSSFCIRTGLEPFSDLEHKLGNLDPQCERIVLGDLNARTALKLDYIECENNADLSLPDNYVTDSVATFPRGNRDLVTNTYGDSLISLCRDTPLRICNGRKLGDTQGNFTCHKWNGQSTVDYCLSSPGIYSQILFLKVSNFLPLLSDHCAITIALRCRLNDTFSFSEYNFIQKPQKLSWDSTIALKFENIIQSKESKNILENLAKNGILPDQKTIDSTTELLTDFLSSSAEKAANNGLAITCKGVERGPGRNWKFRRKLRTKTIRPKWHDLSCEDLRKSINKTATLLKKYPTNSYLRGLIQSESKKYKKLMKSKQKAYISELFKELDVLHRKNPRGYMNIVKSLRDGSFDKKHSNDSEFICPEKWREHFSSLLGPPVATTENDKDLIEYIESNCNKFESELGAPITRTEFLEGVTGLANNKAISFDKISNEILKVSKLVIVGPTLRLFNTILSSGIYPSQWKLDILSPLHKSGDKNDPNNFRGVAVSSCFGKLFNKILHKRLEKWCNGKGFLSEEQGSSKAGSRTTDHLLIVRFLIDKYARKKGGKLYTCFVDLRKAFDTVPRIKLFHCLLKEYSIGGKFLKVIQEMYKDNKIFVKLSDGLLEPFKTTVSVKQGCVLSPILFNLYIDKICRVFDQSCDPVTINDRKLNCLLWADDLLLVSQTATGLQNAINKMYNFYTELGLHINIKKTKVVIFNKRGITFEKKFNFYLNNVKLEITDQYQYLGIKLRPSGSLKLSTEELHDKASRAWFGISNTIFKNKRMDVDQDFGIFDSLITPIATYASDFWLPFVIKKGGFDSIHNLIDSWGDLKAEVLNQKCARMFLSVHSKASRLAVLGELGRYPIFIGAISQCLNYKLSLFSRQSSTNLIGNVLSEMSAMCDRGQDCWLTRVNRIEHLLNLPKNMKKSKTSGKNLKVLVRSKFDKHWLEKINEFKPNKTDNLDHNKLRVYKKFKSSFTSEPYIRLVRNRNQRSSLTRIRISAHTLATEVLRRSRPVIPYDQRICTYCQGTTTNHTAAIRFIDTEQHFMIECKRFKNTRTATFTGLSDILPGFHDLSNGQKFATLMCPTTPQVAKTVNRFIKLMFKKREKIDTGTVIGDL